MVRSSTAAHSAACSFCNAASVSASRWPSSNESQMPCVDTGRLEAATSPGRSFRNCLSRVGGSSGSLLTSNCRCDYDREKDTLFSLSVLYIELIMRGQAMADDDRMRKQ